MSDAGARLSAVVAVFNGERYLAQALDSMLAQDPAPFEIIVVDDGSTDGTRAGLSRYHGSVTVISQPNAGQSAALNVGVAAATGEFLAFNDADDLWVPGRVAAQLQAFAEEPELDMVFGMSRQFVSPEILSPQREHLAPLSEMLVGEIAPCMMIRRDSLARVGLFDPALSMAYFFEWLQRSRAAGLKSRILSQTVSERRLHEGNWGRTHRAERDKELLTTLRRGMARRPTAT